VVAAACDLAHPCCDAYQPVAASRHGDHIVARLTVPLPWHVLEHALTAGRNEMTSPGGFKPDIWMAALLCSANPQLRTQDQLYRRVRRV